MEERKNEIIKGFDEAKNKINQIKIYIEIFNKYDGKLKNEFKRVGKYISDEDYNNNLMKIDTINILELERIIKEYIENFKILDNLNNISEQYATFIINELTNYNWNSMTYISEYIMQKLEKFDIISEIINY